MSPKIRHMERKILVYGSLSAIFVALPLSLAYAGSGPAAILLGPGAIAAALLATYVLFGPVARLLLKADPVGKKDEPRAFRILEEASKGAGYRMPGLAVLPRPYANAFVAGVARDRATLFISRRLLETLDDRELTAVVRHELEAIDEMGWFPYNLAMVALAMLSRLKRRALRLVNPGGDGEVAARHIDRITVDKACPEDVPEAVGLLVAHGMYSSIYVNDLCRLAEDRSPLFLAARCDGRPVGFIVGERSGRTGHISKIVVDERFRRKGIGNILMEAFQDSASRLGCRYCFIEVRTDNARAISLYEKQAFSRERVVPGYYPDGTPCQIMVKAF